MKKRSSVQIQQNNGEKLVTMSTPTVRLMGNKDQVLPYGI